ncbi:hypothetical protein PACTADRAFT_51615 [Pachysolen tannophilus NRRL Y-2460]|uniref:Glycosyltransferase family 34 protein n=1 Tax=Pachysolen tannophilus NRRL Y-2460 TaxID=669874 RepID=A0A1E4TQ30_PACTA|nr:hypothetical protein PACTADRAFT_51615 [Pachysolen tannophilus NRRL Y-2460]
MSSTTNIIKDHKKRLSFRSKFVYAYKTYKLKLKSRDKRTIFITLLFLVIAINYFSNFLNGSYRRAQETVTNIEHSSEEVVEIDLAKKDLLGLDQKYHDILNKKVIPNKNRYDSIGFGTAEYRKLHRKPGVPPMPQRPGILSEVDDLDDDSSALSNKRDGENGKNTLLNSIFNKKPKKRIYIVLGKNPQTGIQNWKSKETWLMEKFSIVNKELYAQKHGYELIVTSSTPFTKSGRVKNFALFQKRYQHETREGWEKFDLLRKIMKENTLNTDPQNPNEVEEWYWYLDMYTLIMEPDISIDDLVLSRLNSVYRDLNYFNPNDLFVDDTEESSKNYDLYDDNENSIDLILTQDCKGINLNSFLIKRSDWSNLLLDILWDPVFYKQMHLKWMNDDGRTSKKYGFTLNDNENDDDRYNNDREDKNCLEYLFNTQSWIRSKIGFMPIRVFNSLSKDFCNEDDVTTEIHDEMLTVEELVEKERQKTQKKNVDAHTSNYINNKSNFHYNETDRDFLVNFMNCEKFGNCWSRFQQFSKINEKLHRRWYEKLFKN